MIETSLLAAAAGVCAAFLLQAVAGGPLPLGLLTLLAPLPIMMAGLAAGWRSALIAASGVAMGLMLAAGPHTGLAFFLMLALPSALIAHLMLLGRAAGTSPPGAPSIEWYPAGRLVIWAGLFAGCITLITLIQLGGDVETLRAALRAPIETGLNRELITSTSGQVLSAADFDAVIEDMVTAFPWAVAMVSMGMLLGNLWLGARLLRWANRLPRPWPDLTRLSFPRGTPVLFVMGMIGSVMLDGLPALAAQGFTAAILLAYVLLGLAIVHHLTPRRWWRRMALWTLYLAFLFFLPFVAPLLAILGLFDGLVPLRGGTVHSPGSSVP